MSFKSGLCVLLAAALVADLQAVEIVKIVNSGFEDVGKDGTARGWYIPKANWKAVKGAGGNGGGALVFDGNDPDSRDWPYQYVDIKPGRRYRLSANLRPDGLKCERGGMAPYMEWFDASNKLIGASMARPCVSGNASGWSSRIVITPKIQDNVAKCRIMAVVVGGAVGRSIIDDFLLEEVEEVAVDGIWSSEYRDESVEGTVTFASCFNILPDIDKKAMTAVFRYKDKTGKTVEAKRNVEAGDRAFMTLDVSEMALGTNDVSCTLVDGGREMGVASMAFARLAAPIPRRCRFDKEKRFFVDGKPFMPIGLYCLEIDSTNMDVIAESPFNCIMSYRRPTVEELDICHARGIKVIYDIRKKFGEGKDDEALGQKWIREQVAKVARHPAVIAWYGDDESPIALVPRLRGRARLLNEIDQDHPVWIAQNHWPEMRYYMGTFNVFGTDLYPLSRHPIDRVTVSMRKANSDTLGFYPVWHVPQGFRWDEGSRRNERMPTTREFANMTWQAIANDANGLVYFRYHQLREADKRNGLFWFANGWPRIWSAAAEVRKYQDVILSAGGKLEVSGAPGSLAVRTWVNGGNPHVLCVNTSTNALSCSIKVKGFPKGDLRVDFADPDVVSVLPDKSLKLTLPSMGYAMMSSP